MSTLRIALAQCRQTDDLNQNSRAIFDFLNRAAESGARIVCFPETQTVGYRVDIASGNTPVEPERLADLHQRVATRCAELELACVLGSEIPLESDPAGGRPYNSAVVISESGEILGTHHKTKLTPLDAVVYSPGDSIGTFELCGVQVGVVICFEAFRFAETTAECVRQGARLILHPQNNTTRPNDGKTPIHESMIVTRAAENTVWFASCNMCHEQHQNCRSMIVAPDGRVHARAELKREELLVADLDMSLATAAMFNYDLEGCAPVLFSDTVDRDEYASALTE